MTQCLFFPLLCDWFIFILLLSSNLIVLCQTGPPLLSTWALLYFLPWPPRPCVCVVGHASKLAHNTFIAMVTIMNSHLRSFSKGKRMHWFFFLFVWNKKQTVVVCIKIQRPFPPDFKGSVLVLKCSFEAVKESKLWLEGISIICS